MAETTNYKFKIPTESDSMATPEIWIKQLWQTFDERIQPTVIDAGDPLPQAGDYEIGDRVFRNDPPDDVNFTWPSIYILVCKDDDWGWHWRPVQQIISPWIQLTDNIFATGDFTIHPTAPLQVAYDSRGWCHWRGAIRSVTPGISTGSHPIFKTIPKGLRPNVSFNHTVAISPIQSGTGLSGYVGGCISFEYGEGYAELRCFNTNNGVSRDIWFTGLRYEASEKWFYNG